MMDGISGSSGLGLGSPTRSPTSAMGQEDFLQLLVAQLRSQDPMSPMNGQEFAAQLAQFAQVEQTIGMRKDMESFVETTAQIRHVMNTSLASELIGKSVLVASDRLSVGAGGKASLEMEVGAGGGTASVTVRDKAGVVVKEFSAGKVRPGRQQLDLSSHGLAEGEYRVEIRVTSPSGDSVPAAALERVGIRGVQFGPQGIQLTPVTGSPIPLSSVVEILDALPIAA